MSYTLKKTILGPTKRKKVRTVYFGSTLLQILQDAREQQLKNEQQYGNLYLRNYYKVEQDKNRSYHKVYSFPVTDKKAEHYTEIDFVCLRQDGTYEAPRTVNNMCISARKQIEGMDDFHFHTLRHTYTSRLLASGAAPKDVQELLGHSDINTTLNIYAHASNESKKKSAMLLD
ncbi:tyrosine-type recombinase/integrase [Oscillospiraceae bacterium PP1C4]